MLSNDAEYVSNIMQADKDRMKPELYYKMCQDVSAKNSFAHIAQESGAESSDIKKILGHSNLANTELYMGSFDTAKTDETLRNVFAKKKMSAATNDSDKSKEELAIELLKDLSPEQIMVVISAINKQK